MKLAWSVNERYDTLVTEMAMVLQAVEDKEIVLGERLEIDFLLKAEAELRYRKVAVVFLDYVLAKVGLISLNICPK